jgi:hypothetical protein
MSAEEDIEVGDIVKFLYGTSPAETYRLGIVRGIEYGDPVHNSYGLTTTYRIEVLGQRIVQTYKPTGKYREFYKHRGAVKKYRAPHFVEQLLRASEPIDPTKVSMRNLPLGANLDILHAAGMIGTGDKKSFYKRLVPPPIRSGDGKWVPGTVENLLLQRKTAEAAGGGSTSAATGGSKSRRTRRNKRLSRRSTRR